MAAKLFYIVSFVLVLTGAPSSGLPSTKSLFKHDPEQFTKLEELAKDLVRFQSTPDSKVAILNAYVDDHLIPNLNEYINDNELEPLGIPDVEKEFKYGFLKAKIKLTEGLLRGLSTIKRTGDVVLRYEYPNLILQVPFGFDNLHFNYNYDLKLPVGGSDGRVEGRSENNALNVEINIDMTTGRLSLRNFQVNSLGSLKIKFSGSILGALLNLIIDLIVPLLKDKIKSVIEDAANDFLVELLAELNNIICQFLLNCPKFVGTVLV